MGSIGWALALAKVDKGSLLHLEDVRQKTTIMSVIGPGLKECTLTDSLSVNATNL